MYHGLCDAVKYNGYGDYRWLNYQKLAENTIRPYQDLIWVMYFTARIKGNAKKQKHQNDYLEALAMQPKIKTYYGNYQVKQSFDRTSGQHYTYPVEKRTDVNLATQLLVDAFQGNVECAYIVSADSDLIPAIEAVRINFPNILV